MTHAGFFAVGRATFGAACRLGLNPAAVLLVLARGSSRDNVTSQWSAEAAKTRLGMRWTTAKHAIEELKKARLIKQEKGSTRPSYALALKGEAIWLPNALVDGVGSETPPVAKLRQTQDPMALRLLVELYGAQNLREDGGISPTVIWRAYQQERIGQQGAFVVWRFDQPVSTASGSSDVTTPHYARLSDAERQAGKNWAEAFFRRLGYLETLGLLDWVPYLFDGPEGEPIHPLHPDSELELETALAAACQAAAAHCLTEGQYDRALSKGGLLAPVPAHIEQVQLIGVARLRYRPHTALTAAWWAHHDATCRQHLAHYTRMASEEAA